MYALCNLHYMYIVYCIYTVNKDRQKSKQNNLLLLAVATFLLFNLYIFNMFCTTESINHIRY